jgi:MFS family permease
MALISLTSQHWHFYLTYGFLLPAGISMAYYIPTVTTVRRWFHRRAGLAVSLALTGSGVGLAVGPVVAQALIDAMGWQSAYRVLAALLAAGVIAGALLLRGDPESIGEYPDGAPAAKIASGLQKHVVSMERPWPIRDALRTRALWLYMMAQAGFLVLIIAMIGHLKVWVDKDLGFGSGYGVAMVAVLAGTAVFARLLGGLASDRLMGRFGRKPVLYLSVVGVVASSFLAIAVDSRVGVAVFAVILGLSYGSSIGVFPTYLGDLYGMVSMPVLLGIVGVESASVSALGPWVFGTVYDRTGSYDLAFLIGAGLAILALVCLALIGTPRRRVGIEIGGSSESLPGNRGCESP